MTDKPDYSPPAYLVLHWTNGVHIDEERATKFQALRTALCEKLEPAIPSATPSSCGTWRSTAYSAVV